MINQIDSLEIIRHVADSTSSISFLDRFETAVLSYNSLTYSFWLSAGALVLVYLIKKLCIKEVHTAFELVSASQEFFIDLCMTMIPLIAISTIDADKAIFGVFLVILSIVLISICAYLRRLSCQFLNGQKYGWVAFMGILCVLLCVVDIFVLYYYISR